MSLRQWYSRLESDRSYAPLHKDRALYYRSSTVDLGCESTWVFVVVDDPMCYGSKEKQLTDSLSQLSILQICVLPFGSS